MYLQNLDIVEEKSAAWYLFDRKIDVLFAELWSFQAILRIMCQHWYTVHENARNINRYRSVMEIQGKYVSYIAY